MEKVTLEVLKHSLEGTCFYPKYPSGDLAESDPNLPFVDSSISDEQFKEEAKRFSGFESFWKVLDYSDLNGLKKESAVFVMHPYKSEIINPEQLAIPIKTIAYLNHKANVNNLGSIAHVAQYPNLKVSKTTSLMTHLQYLLEEGLISKDFVVKAPYSAAGDGVRIFTDFNENNTQYVSSINALEKLSIKRGNFEFLVQEYYKGTDLSLQGFIAKTGEVYFVGHGVQKIGTSGEYNGLEVLVDNPKEEYLTLLSQVAQNAYSKGFFGFFGLDIKETPNGNLYIIDPNFRPTDGTPKYLKAAGIM